MKNLGLKLYPVLILCSILLFGACSDDSKLSSDASIVTSFKVKGASGTLFNSSIGGDNVITIKVSPYKDAAVELDSVTPTFYLSKGATVSPDPSIPQNFAQSGGVKYTVTAQDGKTQTVYTVTWGVSDQLPEGEGFSYAEIGTAKSFVDLGYPGEVGNTGLPAIQYGDLLMYPAYCGDYIVLLSRAYINADPTSPYCIKVVDKTNLNDAGTLNTGSIPVSNIKMITSDYKGHCVATVVDDSNETEFFYWTTPSNAPTSVGKIAVNMASTTDGSNNFQVAGDITGNAWITALAPRGVDGAHYRIKVTGGKLASDYSTVKTGYSSGDCTGFQMISALDDSDNPSFAIGDTEGTAGASNSIHAYINSPSGSTVNVMPGLWQNILQTWWVGTGFSTLRTGGRSPFVSALPINGKTYVIVTSGTNWWYSAAVLSSDLQTPQGDENLNIAFGVAASRGWSYGEWADWYWNDETKEAYLAVWFGRLGLYTYKLTCFE